MRQHVGAGAGDDVAGERGVLQDLLVQPLIGDMRLDDQRARQEALVHHACQRCQRLAKPDVVGDQQPVDTAAHLDRARLVRSQHHVRLETRRLAGRLPVAVQHLLQLGAHLLEAQPSLAEPDTILRRNPHRVSPDEPFQLGAVFVTVGKMEAADLRRVEPRKHPLQPDRDVRL